MSGEQDFSGDLLSKEHLFLQNPNFFDWKARLSIGSKIKRIAADAAQRVKQRRALDDEQNAGGAK